LETQLTYWFENISHLAWLVSILLNVLIAVVVIFPSFFITAANIHFFGFSTGIMISIIGESVGAIISFILYRKGLEKIDEKLKMDSKYLKTLKETTGLKAFILTLGLRIFPFSPSGLVTLASARSQMGLLSFSLATTIGKIPALVIEGYSISEVLNWTWEGKVILLFISIAIVALYIYKKKRRKK
jgi:uncharacterized membrane protein YdjX (TVP38/TMEM64 family)